MACAVWPFPGCRFGNPANLFAEVHIMKRLFCLLLLASLLCTVAPTAVQSAQSFEVGRGAEAMKTPPVQEKWYVQARKGSDKRWKVYGPYSYYDACTKRDGLELKGYAAYLTKKP